MTFKKKNPPEDWGSHKYINKWLCHGRISSAVTVHLNQNLHFKILCVSQMPSYIIHLHKLAPVVHSEL